MGGVGTSSELALGLAAEDHVADIGYTGVVSHSSSDGSCAADRVSRYGRFRSTAESLWYGSAKADARTIVLDLIVDDGVASRGHRLCVCNPIWEVVGVAYGPHSTFGTMSAMEFAAGWSPDAAAADDRRASGPVHVAGQEEAKKSVITQWKLGGCLVCNQEIKGGAVMEIEKLGGKVHKDCFNCKSCSKPLKGIPWNAHERSIFCKPCYSEQHGERCTGCSKPIEGGMMNCALGKFHVECVICATCKKSIGKASFSTAGGAISCQACSSQKVRTASVGRLSGLTVDGGSGAVGGRASSALGREPRMGLLVAAGSGSRSGSTQRASSPAAVGKAASKAAPVPPKAAPKGTAKAKAAGGKLSMASAGARLVGLGMDYSALG